MEYYLALKRSEILTHATTWMNPENVMLSEVKTSHKMTNIVWSHTVYEIPRVIIFTRTEKRGWVPRQTEGEQCLMRTGFPFGEAEDSSGDGWYWRLYINVNVLNATELLILSKTVKMVNFICIFYHSKKQEWVTWGPTIRDGPMKMEAGSLLELSSRYIVSENS